MELQKKLDELGEAFDAFKTANDVKLKEIESKGHASADATEKVEKLNTHIEKLEGKIEEMNAAIARKAQGGDDTKGGDDKDEAKKYSAEFQKFMRKRDYNIEEASRKWAGKSMSVDSDDDGGFFVSPDVSSEIVKKVFESSPIRELASQQTISSDSLEIIYDGDEVASGWVGEIEARAETGTPQIQKIVIYAEELYANPAATQKFLDDAAINVEAWLAAKTSEKFGRDEATSFISGNGVKKPKGFLAYASGTAFNQIERIRTATAASLDGNDAIDTQASLKEAYQMNATWLMNRLVVGEFRKLKDTTSGQYIWQPGLTVGQPNTLLGRPVRFATDLDSALAIDNNIALYGDFRAGYQIVDRVGIRVLRDPYTNKPYVHFYTTKRVGGGVKDFDAVKVLQCKAS